MMRVDQMCDSSCQHKGFPGAWSREYHHGTGSVCDRLLLLRIARTVRLAGQGILCQDNACVRSSIPALIRDKDSSFPRISMISVAPAGVICLPETAVRTGQST